MKLRYAILMAVTLLAKTGFSQEEPAKIDLFGEYSYLRFNPSLPGLQSRSFNGGGGAPHFSLVTTSASKASSWATVAPLGLRPFSRSSL